MKDQKPKSIVRDGCRVSRDSTLQIARRIDWRFLLPNPRLGHVAYMGPPRETLLAALDQFGESLTLISPSDQTWHAQSNPSGFELVVLRSQSMASVEKAHALLRAGGYLYWEIDLLSGFASIRGITKRDGRQKRWALRSVHSDLASLERLGFCDIQVHWHRAGFEDCHEMIPLHDQSVLAYVFSRKREGLAAHITLAAGRLLLKTGWLPWLVPYFSIVARKL